MLFNNIWIIWIFNFNLIVYLTYHFHLSVKSSITKAFKLCLFICKPEDIYEKNLVNSEGFDGELYQDVESEVNVLIILLGTFFSQDGCVWELTLSYINWHALNFWSLKKNNFSLSVYFIMVSVLTMR